MSELFHGDRLAENELCEEKAGVPDHGRMALPCQLGSEHGAVETPHK